MPDSLFAFGRVHDPNGRLTVNGLDVEIQPSGAWLSWTPVTEVNELSEAPDSASAEIAPPPLLATTLTVEYTSPRTKGTVNRQPLLIAQKKPLHPWELPRFEEEIGLVVTAENAKIRCGWPGTTYLYPDPGTRLTAVASSDTGEMKLYRLDMPGGLDAWIESEYVTIDTTGNPAELQVVKRVNSEVDGRETRILIPLEESVPYLAERTDDHRLVLTLFGAVSWTDVIKQPWGSRTVDEIRWSQPDSGVFQLTAFVDPAWFWGWSTEVDTMDTTLVWTIREAPALKSHPLDGLTVIVDPGHGGENISAIGPTGLFESRANLALSEALANELRASGAHVLMTREQDSFLGLLDRIQFSREWNADILLSVHHNGLPQGVNPYRSRGPSIHYVHRHAKPMADAILGELASLGEVAGIKYQDLALARPSWLPALLLEAGYLLHPDEEQASRNPRWREEFARAVRKGLEAYLEDLRTMQDK
jgi:N-acetylmuramoyl-L-alanine amidase